MINYSKFDSIYLHRDAVDFRKSIEGLSVIVQDEMQQNIFSDHLFVFTNKRRNKVKILYWDKTGHALWYKRLDQKQFKWPSRYDGEILWDTDKPDGTPKKLLDSSRFLSLGWRPSIPLETGLRLTYEWFLKNSGIKGI